jgi:peroxiredoxin family protein
MVLKKINYIVKDRSFEKFAMMAILGSTGSAMDIEMHFFCTFWGLRLLKKNFKPKARGMPFPMKGMGAWMFKKRLKKGGIDSLLDLIKDAVAEGKMKLYPCTTTMDLMKIKREDLLDFVEEPIGAAGFLELCSDADAIISL